MDEEDVVRVDGRFVPLHQLLDFIEGNDDAIPNTGVDITLLPPTNATADMTDEDSGEEDNVEIDNVPPSQVNAPALLEVVNIPFDEQKSNICENENTEELSKNCTIRSNRFGKGCPISESKTVKKKPRGSMEYASDHDSGLFTERIRIYHCTEFSIRGKKWYFPLIAHLLDVSVQNAWQLHRQDGGKLDQLAFRRRIVLAVLEGNKRVVSGRGRPSTSSKIDSRYDRIDHIVSDIENDPRTGKKETVALPFMPQKGNYKVHEMRSSTPCDMLFALSYEINVLFTSVSFFKACKTKC
ncbi:uncharacterized protein LOC124371437 [Homalodisca vitripennis]|uniref:uncharacterized protein LOC124371437 n=1 Tax=Homalodisca vitripennis TaxID=197043 RepID=UPI001EECAE91|nr:uncharacterized protein LOC124371437 [Homalodisca vitripennis]